MNKKRTQVSVDDELYTLLKQEKEWLESTFHPKKFSFSDAMRNILFNNPENKKQLEERKNALEKLQGKSVEKTKKGDSPEFSAEDISEILDDFRKNL